MPFNLRDIQIGDFLSFGPELPRIAAEQTNSPQGPARKWAVQRIDRERQVLAVLQIDDALGHG